MIEPAFLVIGEALVDMISEAGSWQFQATAGGSPLNVAAGLGAAGHQVRLAAEVGDDLFGELIRNHLRRYQVDPDLVVTTAPTSLAVANLDRSGAANYQFRLSWTWPGPAQLSGVTCLHTGSLAAVLTPGADAVAAAVVAARDRGITVSFDPNIRPPLLPDRAAARDRIEQLISLADVVKASSEDLTWLYPDRSDLATAAHWAGQGPWLVVVTRGEHGAVALHHGYEIKCAAPPVEVIDTVGAGDAFTAALLSRLAGALPTPDSDQVRAALAHATTSATAVCARRGASF